MARLGGSRSKVGSNILIKSMLGGCELAVRMP